MKDSFTKEELLILERFSCDPAYAKYLVRIGRARKSGKDLAAQINHIDKFDTTNYVSIREDLNKCKKTINKLSARLNCIVENNAFSMLPYSELRETFLKIIDDLNTTITNNIDPNIKNQNDKLFFMD